MLIDEVVTKMETTIEDSITNMFRMLRKEGKELSPMAHMVGVGEDGLPSHEVMLAGVPMEEFAPQVRKQALKNSAVWVALAAEAWSSQSPAAAEGDIRPRDDPDRKEILTLLVEGPLGRRYVTWEILEGGELGERFETTHATGRMTGLLPEKETTN